MSTSAKIKRFAAISKVADNADGTVTVFGIASNEALDAHGEVVTKVAMENAIPDFMKYGTGALRSMHQPIAAGVVTKCTVDDAGNTVIEAHVVDPVEVLKVQTGVYKGFSIGGNKVPGGYDAVSKTINAMTLTEISLVDRPANPEAVITMFKLEDDPTVTVSPDDATVVEQLADLLNKSDVSPARMLELVQAEITKAKVPPEFAAENGTDEKDKKKGAKKEGEDEGDDKGEETKKVDTPAAKEETPEEKKKREDEEATEKSVRSGAIQKSMYNVSRFAELMTSVGYLVSDAEWEASCRTDGSGVPESLRTWLSAGAKIFQTMATEEVAAFIAQFATPESSSAAIAFSLSDATGDLRKSLDAAAAESLSSYLNIAKAHMPENDIAKAVLSDGFAKATDAVLARMAPGADAIAKLATANEKIAKLESEVVRLSALPVQSGARLRVVVEKGADLPIASTTPVDTTVKKADGTIDGEATAMAQIKKLHQSGGQPIHSFN